MAPAKKPHGEITVNEWMLELEKLRSAERKEVTPTDGWALSVEWARRWKISERTTSRMIKTGLENGTWEMKSLKRKTLTGHLKSFIHYRPKKN